jgi:glutamate-5-semialdehyde dehydrogenase
MSEMTEKARAARRASYGMAKMSTDAKNAALHRIADSIWSRRDEVLEANGRDMAAAAGMLESGLITAAMMKRLALNADKVQEIVDMIRSVAALDDPVGKTLQAVELDEGLKLFKVTSPLGVVAVIFESRPDALTQITSLCLKSGNSVLLKGGTEARNSNRMLYKIIDEACPALPEGWIQIMEDREEVSELLKLDEYVDFIIPRGSNEFVSYIQSNTSIPVLGHADGVCHIYVDEEADVEMAVSVCHDAKVQYPSVCNAVDTILVHEAIADRFLPAMVKRFKESEVEVRGCRRVNEKVTSGVVEATSGDWGKEYLDYVVALKIVDDVEEAVDHINAYGSHHTDAIVTANEETAETFMESVDSAGVFWNASTRFSDGYRYGLGSEVGISTGKIHARGPTGLDGLTIHKYYLKGGGHVVADYSGVNPKRFMHRPLDEEWKD